MRRRHTSAQRTLAILIDMDSVASKVLKFTGLGSLISKYGDTVRCCPSCLTHLSLKYMDFYTCFAETMSQAKAANSSSDDEDTHFECVND